MHLMMCLPHAHKGRDKGLYYMGDIIRSCDQNSYNSIGVFKEFISHQCITDLDRGLYYMGDILRSFDQVPLVWSKNLDLINVTIYVFI